jgi:hypothetical protein
MKLAQVLLTVPQLLLPIWLTPYYIPIVHPLASCFGGYFCSVTLQADALFLVGA